SRGATIDVISLASVIATAEDFQEIDGQKCAVVVGRPVGNTRQSKLFVGNIPTRPPRPDAWGAPFLAIPRYEPPPVDPSPVDGIAHVNLDAVLQFLIGDLL